MFGIFKKPDATQSAKQCLECWNQLSTKDKALVSINILKLSELLQQNCKSTEDALVEISTYKQAAISHYNLKNEQHPAFIQIQILSDLIFGQSQGNIVFDYVLNVFKTMTVELAKVEQQQLANNLRTFVQWPNYGSSQSQGTTQTPQVSSVTDQRTSPPRETPTQEGQSISGSQSTSATIAPKKKLNLAPGGLVNSSTGEVIPSRYLKRVENPVPGFEITAFNFSTVWVKATEIEDQ